MTYGQIMTKMRLICLVISHTGKQSRGLGSMYRSRLRLYEILANFGTRLELLTALDLAIA